MCFNSCIAFILSSVSGSDFKNSLKSIASPSAAPLITISPPLMKSASVSSLSSGEGKIKGENALYEYKKTFFSSLDRKTKRYIKMRHYAVLAFAELRMKRIISTMRYCFKSFVSAPIQCVGLFVGRKM